MTKVATTTEHSTEADVHHAMDRLRADSVALRKALEHFHESKDQAWKEYTAEVDRILARSNGDLEVAGAALRAQRAESREALRTALNEAEKTGESWLDDLRVQAELGRMDLRDELRSALSRLEHATGAFGRMIGHVAEDASTDLAELRASALKAIDEFRRALADVQHKSNGHDR